MHHFISQKEKQKQPRSGDPFCKTLTKCRRGFKGQHDGGNKTVSLLEANLPLRGSLRGSVFWFSFEVYSEVFRFEVFSSFLRFSLFLLRWSVFLRGPLRDPIRGRFPSQRLSVLLPLIVLPRGLSLKMLGSLQINSQSANVKLWLACFCHLVMQINCQLFVASPISMPTFDEVVNLLTDNQWLGPWTMAWLEAPQSKCHWVLPMNY